MDGLELICFEIISNVGGARSCFIEAIDLAIEKKFDEAEKLIAEGKEYFTKGHHAHAQLIQQEAAEGSTSLNILLVHAEDQLMSAETFQILADKFILLSKTL